MVESSKLGKASRVTDAAGRYIEFCKSTVPPMMDLAGMKLLSIALMALPTMWRLLCLEN